MDNLSVEKFKTDLERKLDGMTVVEQDEFLNKYGFKYQRKTNQTPKKAMREKSQSKRQTQKDFVVASAVTEC